MRGTSRRHGQRVGPELLAGLVTALALIPETISFSIVAGVDPRVGLLSSFTFSVVIAVLGGRPAMVSAAAGSMALVAAPLVREHGLDYLIAATILCGIIQLLLTRLGIARLLTMLPRGVMIGFVNGLAILIFLSQMGHIVSPLVLVLVVAGAVIMLVARQRNVRIPPSLISTAVLTGVAVMLSLDAPTVADEGALPSGLPAFDAPDVPFTLETLWAIFPTALSLAAVGLVESMLTADLVDRITQTRTSRAREAYGQGVANMASAVFGGQPGCAMIGQSLLNVDSGGRGRLSTAAAGVWLLILVVALQPLMEILPTAALVATMVVVAGTTFDWRSVAPARLRSWPVSETAVMVVTTVVVVVTSNLAIGVLAGGILASILFIRRALASMHVESRASVEADDVVTHHVHGALFFASSGRLVDALENLSDVRVVHIDLSRSHVWDATAALALNQVISTLEGRGVRVEIHGENAASATVRSRVGGVTAG